MSEKPRQRRTSKTTGEKKRKMKRKRIITAWATLFFMLFSSVYTIASGIGYLTEQFNGTKTKTTEYSLEEAAKTVPDVKEPTSPTVAENNPLIDQIPDKDILKNIIELSKKYNFDKTKASELKTTLSSAGYNFSLDEKSNLFFVDALVKNKEILDGVQTIYFEPLNIASNRDLPIFTIEKLENEEMYNEVSMGENVRIYPNLESWFTLGTITQGSYGFENPSNLKE